VARREGILLTYSSSSAFSHGGFDGVLLHGPVASVGREGSWRVSLLSDDHIRERFC